MTTVSREKWSVWGCCDKYSWMEDTKTRAVSSLVSTWVLVCLHCLEMYMLQNSGNCIWKRNVVLSSAHPLSYPLQPTLSHHLPYQFFIFSSLSLLNTNVIYYVPILNCNLKKILVFIKPAGKWNFYAWVKEGLWCHYINCNLKSLTDSAFFYYYYYSWFTDSVKSY